MSDYALPLYGTDSEEQRKKLFPGLSMQPTPQPAPWLPPRPAPQPARPDAPQTALLPRPAVAPIAPDVPRSEPQPSPLAKVVPVAASGPNLQQDTLNGQVARPAASDYKPQPESFGKQLLGRIAAGMVGFKNPEAGVAIRRRQEDMPRVLAQQAFQNDEGTFDKAFGQGIQAQQAQREVDNTASEIKYREAQAAALNNKPDPRIPTVESGGQAYQYNPQSGRYDIPIGSPKAETAGKSLEDQYDAAVRAGDSKRANQILGEMRNAASAKQTPERLPRQTMVVPDGNGGQKVIEVHPGDTLPAGATTVADASKEKKPTADEQRRADLAENLNENLDQLEDILTRRPDLFGKVSGRMTTARGFIGTEDPDVAALKVIKEQMGMAMVGAHAMRNANHVETAANSIVNSFNNSPGAVKAAVKAARASLKTFQGDVDRSTSKNAAPAVAPGAIPSFADWQKNRKP